MEGPRYLFHLQRGACRVRPAGNSPFQFALRNRLGFTTPPQSDPPPSGVDPFGYTPVCTGISSVTSD